MEILLRVLFILLTETIIHESTHYILDKLKGYKPKFMAYNRIKIEGVINHPKQIKWNLLGPLITTPLYVIIVSVILNIPIIWIILILIAVIYGCTKDISTYILISKIFKEFGNIDDTYELTDDDIRGLRIWNIDIYYNKIIGGMK